MNQSDEVWHWLARFRRFDRRENFGNLSLVSVLYFKATATTQERCYYLRCINIYLLGSLSLRFPSRRRIWLPPSAASFFILPTRPPLLARSPLAHSSPGACPLCCGFPSTQRDRRDDQNVNCFFTPFDLVGQIF